MTRSSRLRIVALAAVLALVPALAVPVAAPGLAALAAADNGALKPPDRRAVFFASDGLRQDLVKEYAAQGVMPTMSGFLKNGASASGNGLLTQAPPNTGAGWYTLATGAWPGVHASTNNTFHVNGQPFGNRTSAFDANVLKAESIAQSAERGGLKVAQVEWAGGRNATIKGPTIDFQSFFSGRGVSTNFIGQAGDTLFDDASFISAFGLQFDTPAGYAGQAPFPGAAPTATTGWSGALPSSFSPAKEMRLRVLDFGADKYGLNAYIFDSTDDQTTNYDKVLFSRTKDAADAVGTLAKGQVADVKVKIQGGALDGQTAGMLVKVEELTGDLSRVRLFHTSVSRAIASWPTWGGEPGFTGDFAEFLAQRFPTSTAADFAILEAGITSEETYVEQGLYWATGHLPMLEYVAKTYQPDLLLVGMPTTDEFQHQFLGLVSRTLPNGDPNPAYDDADLNGVPDGRVAAREGFLRTAYQESDETLTLARRLLGEDPTTFVSSDHGFAPQFLAIDASLPLVDMGLLSRPQTSNCRPATGETIGKAKACWAGGAVQIYLNVDGRDPAGGGFTQVPAADVAATVAAIKAKYLGLTDPNDWTHDGQPEGWKMIDRVFSKAEARHIPNGPGSTADMAHPTRTGDVVAFSFPPYQFDAETPGTLVAPSHFFGQHGYVPDVQDLADNINMRATFLAGGEGIAKGEVKARSIDLAPTLAYLLGIPEPQHSQGKVLLDIVKGGNAVTPISIVGLNDFHGQLEPTTLAFDGINTSVGGGAFLATMFDEELDSLPGPGLILAAGDNVGASPPNSLLLEDKPAIDVENAWGLDATSYGNHEFDYGVERLLMHQERADFPFLATNIVETATGRAPPWVTPSTVFTVNGVQVGVIGAELQEHARARLRRGDGRPVLPRRGAADPGRVGTAETARRQGPGRRHPPGHQRRPEPDRQRRRCSLGGADPRHRRRPSGHDRRRHDRRPHPPDLEPDARPHPHHRGHQRRDQLLGPAAHGPGRRRRLGRRSDPGGQDPRRGAACRRPGDHRRRQRPDRGAPQPGHRDPAERHHARAGPPPRVGDGQHGRRRDAAQVPGCRRRLHQLRRPAAEPRRSHRPVAGEQPGEITWGEMFAVLPFGNRTVILTLTGAQLRRRSSTASAPFCDPPSPGPAGSRRSPDSRCSSTAPGSRRWSTRCGRPDGSDGPLTPIGPTDTVRLVTNDFMFGGGDGYTVFTGGTDVAQPGDDLLQVAID